jgi:2-iminoacetate synthase
MSFIDALNTWPPDRVVDAVQSAAPEDVARALAREDRTPEDLAALISPQALPHLEAMAREAQRLTRWHFGRTINLYAPLYLSNLCAADCVYCGFSFRSGIKDKRLTLAEDQIRRECEALASQGFQSILLLTGEAPKLVKLGYLEKAVAIAREYFASVSVEVFSLNLEGYAKLCRAGLEGVTLYMETYHRPTYGQVHLAGDKTDYLFRLDALERAGKAGARRLNLGALLGLYDWRVDGFWTALHARYLQKTCWQSAVAVSFPRLRHTPERFHIPHFVQDAELVQLMLAMRLFLPEAGLVLSTREPAALRDRLLPLGVTQMSAGSSTRPGGYAGAGSSLEQFEIEDRRTAKEVAEVIARQGYDPVWKDFDAAFTGPSGHEETHHADNG